ncbi:hypothetical protein Tco_1135906 [Tanacetum coccineum]
MTITLPTTMAVLESCPKHNMVAYLEKTEGNAEFHEIIDFLKQSSIHHALTISLVVSTTFVEQFWTSAKSKIINNVRHITSKVAGKSVSISEASIRTYGVPIEQKTSLSARPSPTTFIPDSIPETSGGNLGGHSSSDKSLSGDEDQAKEIQHLKAQIIKLKKQAKPVIKHHRAWLKSVSLKQRLTRKCLSKKQRVYKESVSKQGRKFANSVNHPPHNPPVQSDPLAAPDELPPPATIQWMHIDNWRMLRMKGVSTDKEKVSTNRPIVSTDGSKVSTDRKIEGTEEQFESTDGQRKGTEDHTKEGNAPQGTQTPASTIFGDDETIAKVLLNMSQAKAVSREKNNGCRVDRIIERKLIDWPTIYKITHTPPPPSNTTPLPKIDQKDKGKDRKLKSGLESDEEMARKIQEEWEGEEERNKIAEEKATNEALIRNFDDIKSRIEADRLLAKKLQEQEREQFTIEERAKFLHDTINAQRKFLAQQRSEAIRNRPPTKNQLRNQMMTYLKHVGNFKHSDLKIKKFEEIQVLYEKIKRSDEDFISIGSAEDERLIKKMNEKGVDASKGEEIKEENKKEVKEENKGEESIRKRKLGTRKKMKLRKRRYIQNTSEDDSEKENDELRLHLTITPDEEKEVDYEILDRKYPFKEWKIEYFKMRYLKGLIEYLGRFDGVHTLVTEGGLVIHMLVEKKYPLKKEVLVQMLKLKLESEEDSTMALELIRVLNSPCFLVKSWLVQDQTVLGKDYLNLLIAHSLLKTIWFINVPCYGNEALASPKANELTIPEQTATSKGTSNPLMIWWLCYCGCGGDLECLMVVDYGEVELWFWVVLKLRQDLEEKEDSVASFRAKIYVYISSADVKPALRCM